MSGTPGGVWPPRGPVVVTGTDTGVGKTIVTAAVAAAAATAGLRVAVVKPGQTGTATDEETDVATVRRLAAPASARSLAEYPDPLAPLTAARVAGLPAIDLSTAVDEVRADASRYDLVLVEGAGGLLVQLGESPGGDTVAPWTVADLAVALGAPAIVVARAGLGTLNHTALTLEALDRRGIPACVVIGAWPADPGLAERCNLTDLAGDLAGLVPDGAGGWRPDAFRAAAPGWLTPTLFGSAGSPRTLLTSTPR
ncbi:MAG TPA: dethiobiotin synthase [Micromonosporaceae bacterium]